MLQWHTPMRSLACGLVAIATLAAMLAAAPARADQADDLFAAAAAHYTQNRWRPAAEQFQAFLERFANHARTDEAVFLLAESLLQTGQLEPARGRFHEYLNRQPNGRYARPALFRAGEAAYLAGQHDLAATDLKRFLHEYTDDKLNAYVLPYLGDIALGQGDAAAAEQSFRQGLTQFPEGRLQDDCRFGLARALERRGENEEAERLYMAVAAKLASPLADDAQCHLGVLQYATGNCEEAIRTFAAFETTFADSLWQSNARLGHGWALRKLGRLDEAKRMFEKITSDAKVGVEAWYWLAMVQRAEADWAAAAASLQNAARAAGPTHESLADIRFHAGDSLLRAGRPAEALRLFQQVHASTAQDAPWVDEALAGEIRAELELKKYDIVERLAAEFERRFPQSPVKGDVGYLLALAYVAQQRYGDAIPALDALMGSKPAGDRATEARGTLAVCYARTGRLDEAKRLYAQLVQSSGTQPLGPILEQLADAAYQADDSPWAAELFGRLQSEGASREYGWKGLAGLAWSQFKLGQLPEAAASFEKLSRQDLPADMAAEVLLVRGQIFERLDRQDAALAVYDQLIDNHPNAKQHAQALFAAARLRDKLQQDRQSAELYDRLAKDYPDFADMDAVLYERAWVADDLGDAPGAAHLFERIRNEHPQSRYRADATYRLALRAYLAKDYGRASELLVEVLADQNGGELRQNALDLSGHIAVAREDWPRVEATFGALAKESPDGPKRLIAEYYVADAAYRQKDYVQAARRLEGLLAQTEGQQETWVALIPLRYAQALAQQRQWKEALAVAAKIEPQHPSFAQQYEADYLIGRCLAALADFQAARDAYQKVLRSPQGAKTETAAMAQLMIAETFWHQKDYATALREYAKVETAYTYPAWQAIGLLQVGKCQEKLGQAREAEESYARLLRLYPQTEAAAQVSQKKDSLTRAMPAQPAQIHSPRAP